MPTLSAFNTDSGDDGAGSSLGQALGKVGQHLQTGRLTAQKLAGQERQRRMQEQVALGKLLMSQEQAKARAPLIQAQTQAAQGLVPLRNAQTSQQASLAAINQAKLDAANQLGDSSAAQQAPLNLGSLLAGDTTGQAGPTQANASVMQQNETLQNVIRQRERLAGLYGRQGSGTAPYTQGQNTIRTDPVTGQQTMGQMVLGSGAMGQVPGQAPVVNQRPISLAPQHGAYNAQGQQVAFNPAVASKATGGDQATINTLLRAYTSDRANKAKADLMQVPYTPIPGAETMGQLGAMQATNVLGRLQGQGQTQPNQPSTTQPSSTPSGLAPSSTPRVRVYNPETGELE